MEPASTGVSSLTSGLRVQYRGNLYSAPNVTSLFSSTNTFTHTAEPMIGIYFSL